MKKVLATTLVLALLFSLAIISKAESTGNAQKLDLSIFEVPADFYATYLSYECMDALLHLGHYEYQGVTFFRWGGGDNKMPANTEENECCFTLCPTNLAYDNVVFWNGVPNLGKDLFKWWEGKAKNVYIPDSVTEIDEECFVEGSHITIHFTKNNAVVLAYAQNRGMAFEVMDGERVSGDVNFDQEIDMKDTLSLRKSIANLPAAVEIYSTDLNADGNTDMKDVLVLRKQIATAAA